MMRFQALTDTTLGDTHQRLGFKGREWRSREDVWVDILGFAQHLCSEVEVDIDAAEDYLRFLVDGLGQSFTNTSPAGEDFTKRGAM